MQNENSTKDNLGLNEQITQKTEMEKKQYKVRYDMLGKEGIVTITMDTWFTYKDAVATIKESISWMKSASIVKVKEEVVGLFTKNDFTGGD
ncbi:MAG: hypothetical protein K5790_10440 [Nitrosopumilus sp.]|uniref:hypothetical protein n=1 Tax=Nitrosopumilus sp. TaxID=2024843 RepID=UPI00247BFBA3|nr:hypothetical protein [Nitrosopumilus sp.]MCV0393688.1 hypothetical protein [Nitrosopumilus sp.]